MALRKQDTARLIPTLEKLNLPNRGPSSSASDLPNTHPSRVERHQAKKPTRFPPALKRGGETSPLNRGDELARVMHRVVFPAPRSPVTISARSTSRV